MNKSLYQILSEAGVEVSSYYSDMYFPVNAVTIEIVKKYKNNNNVRISTFRNNLTGNINFEAALSFDPYWEKRGF